MTRRSDVIANNALSGLEACHALADVTDRWLIELFDSALANEKQREDIALIAVGGYGRRELAPHSDLDVLLVHRNVKSINDIASHIWYPLWDAKVKLGHAVRTPKETLQLCATDLDTATALLTGRVVVGNASLGDDVIADAAASWKKRGQQWLHELHTRIIARY